MNKEENHFNKCPICGRPTHKESKHCIFHASAEEKNEEEFKQALKEYIQKIKEEDSDYNFEGFVFVGYIMFKRDLKNANFVEATFEGPANFVEVTFEGRAGFARATFKRPAYFMEVTFEKFAYFVDAIFESYAGFKEATFKSYAGFKEATFKGVADFMGVTFEEPANFFLATFENDADFRLKFCDKNVFLIGIKVFSGSKLFIKLHNEGGTISFERAYLENSYLEFGLVEGILIDFTDVILKNIKIKKGQIENHILQEKREEFSKAKEIYLILKNNFHNIGQYEDESWAFTKERDMERMSKSFYALLNKYKKYSLFKKILMQSSVLKRVIIQIKIFEKWLSSKRAVKWFNLSVSDFIYQYGENPWRVIRFAFIIIFLFAIILNLTGIVNSDSTNLIIEFIKENQGDGYTLRYLGSALGSFLNCLYFSVVTFTTLGYGDFRPAVGLSRFFVSLESIIGAFTMALFVYTFARRTGGR